MLALLRTIGRTSTTFFGYLGTLIFLLWETLYSLVRMPIRWRLALKETMEIGYRTQLVVMVTGAFTGAVFSAQTFFQFHKIGMDTAVGAVVTVSMFRELGPVLTGLMVAGRVGASIAAEIGTMKVTEQIDALRGLGVHPVDYLVVPRVIAIAIAMPLLVVECIGMGIFAGKIVAVNLMGVKEAYYIDYILKFTSGRDIKMALTKGAVFGVLIVFIACNQGLRAREGAVGVGQATTQSVVICSLAILIVNFFLTLVLNLIYPAG